MAETKQLTAPNDAEQHPQARFDPPKSPELSVKHPALRTLRQFTPAFWLSLTFIAVLLTMAAFPGLFTAADPNATDLANRAAPPGPTEWLGTDELGRSIFARIVHGTRYSMLIGLSATALSLAIGLAIGVVAGTVGGFVAEGLMRFVDILGAFPGLLLALLVIALTEPGMSNVVLAIGIGGAASFSRVIRAETLKVVTADFVQVARTLGLRGVLLALRHVLPNILGPLPVIITLHIGGAITGAAALSFLGLGTQPPTAEWGSMLSSGQAYLGVAPWVAIFPGAMITLVVVAFTAVGRELQTRVSGR